MTEQDHKMQVLSIRCDEGIVDFLEAYTAEAEIAEQGKKVYLEASWVSEVPEEISFEKNNESIHQYMIEVSKEDLDRLVLIRQSGHIYTSMSNAYRSKYGPVFRKLAGELAKKLEEEGYFEDNWDEEEKFPSWYQNRE